MRFLVILLAPAMIVNAAIDTKRVKNADVEIVQKQLYHNKDGSFKHGFETSNGITVEEEGFIGTVGRNDEKGTVIRGSYSYLDPDGVPVSITYRADENGFHAQGTRIPTPPPLPKALKDAFAKANKRPEPLVQVIHEGVHYSRPDVYNKL
ncbi:cuticle protein CP14.6-like [Toxorhynchites rutilus septentrionalis]|uniref:cuticle protein CP14.6-like n=1 Tax=Toxorhynchites rutilus septentrionalis TaxID=329112 RepID=UPI00247B0F62|nr:cuticle protein CP14.6-like [Toxorhynchites rutilus septentrionalis]